MRNRVLFRISALLAFGWALVCAPQPAWAKKAVFEWEEIEGSLGYELEWMAQGQQKPHLEKIDKTRVKKDLPGGVYQYRIRGMDQFKRPGEWSDWASLILMPEQKPELVSPGNGSSLRFFTDSPRASFEWKPILGVTQYQLVILQKGKVVREISVPGTRADVEQLPAGEFEWKVNGQLVAHGKSFNAPASSAWDLTLVRQDLVAPGIRSPIGGVALTRLKKKVSFRWDEVNGAQAYEIRLWKPAASAQAVASGRAPAGEKEEGLKVYRVKGNKADLTLPNGNYRWQVRALASISPKAPPYAGPISVQDFVVSPHAGYQEGSGWMAVSAMFAPYQYKYESRLGGGTARAAAISTIARLSGEYWFMRFMGIGAGVDFNIFRMMGVTHLSKAGELQLKFRIKFGKDKWGGWVFQPRVGGEIKDFWAVSPVSSAMITVMGPDFGFDLRKQLKEKFSLGLRLTYFLPLGVTGLVDSTAGSTVKASDFKLNGFPNLRNLTVGLIGAYWPKPKLGIGVGAYLELKSLAVTIPQSAANSPESVYMDGVYVYSTLIYRFGK